jgi:hypothetical protein
MLPEASGDYLLTRWLFQRALAVIYLVGFAAAVNQFRPLLGTRDLSAGAGVSRARGILELSHACSTRTTRTPSRWRSPGPASSSPCFALSGFSESFGTPVSMTVWALMWLLYLSVRERGADLVQLRLGDAAAGDGFPGHLPGAKERRHPVVRGVAAPLGPLSA